MRKMRKLLLLLGFILAPMLLMAQTDPGEPCDDSDPFDNECPLDSWIYFVTLTPLAVTLAALYFKGQAVKKAEDQTEDQFIAEHYYEPNRGHEIAA